MAQKTSQDASNDSVEELLDTVDKTMERLKTLYEQYFLGIQKQAPAFIHNDIERKLRDLTQLNIRNTGLRYRLATLNQKFGSYNSYWRRTLRQIENGTYARNLSKIGRQAARTGADIPEEILAAMPKRMREQVLRDREQALAIASRKKQLAGEGEASPDEAAESFAAPAPRQSTRASDGAHLLADDDGEMDFDSFFKQLGDDTQPGAPSPFAEHEPEPAPAPPPVAAPLRAASLGMPTPRPGQFPRAPTPAPVVPRPSFRLDTQSDEPTQLGVSIPAAPAVPTRPSGPVPTVPASRQSGPIPTAPPARPSAPIPAPPTGGYPRAQTPPPVSQSGGFPKVPAPGAPSGAIPKAPSQITRPNPIVPGSAAARGPVDVESMAGPFPRTPTPNPGAPVPKAPPVAARPAMPSTPTPRPAPARPDPGMRPPPGMSDADVNALYAKYVQAKQMVGETAGPGARDKLLKTINAQAPKIMEQYKAQGVDFSVVVKDNQVIIRAKPKGGG